NRALDVDREQSVCPARRDSDQRWRGPPELIRFPGPVRGVSDATVANVTREIISRAPTRIDLGGGWTDVPPYSDREGGFVCNVAIDRYAFVRLSGATGAGNG